MPAQRGLNCLSWQAIQRNGLSASQDRTCVILTVLQQCNSLYLIKIHHNHNLQPLVDTVGREFFLWNEESTATVHTSLLCHQINSLNKYVSKL